MRATTYLTIDHVTCPARRAQRNTPHPIRYFLATVGSTIGVAAGVGPTTSGFFSWGALVSFVSFATTLGSSVMV